MERTCVLAQLSCHEQSRQLTYEAKSLYKHTHGPPDARELGTQHGCAVLVRPCRLGLRHLVRLVLQRHKLACSHHASTMLCKRECNKWGIDREFCRD